MLRNRLGYVVIALVLAVVTAPVAAAAHVAGPAPATLRASLPAPPQADPFYTPPDPLPDVEPGTVLRSRPVGVRALLFPVPVAAHQVLYRSTGARGEPNAVSGTVLVPRSPWAGSGPRPLVSYAIGTHGFGDQCAPSYQLRLGIDPEVFLMGQALARGWAVAVTDYEGLGTPGPHTYTAGRSQGRAVLDAARSALALPEAGLAAASPVGIWGYSQGGQSAGWAGQLHPEYAPELDVRGVAPGGTPADLEAVLRFVDGGPGSGLALAAAVGLSATYPELPFQEILTAEGRRAAAAVPTQCVAETTSRYAFRTVGSFTTVPDPASLPEWQAVLAENRLGAVAPDAPVLLYHGTADELVPIGQADVLRGEWCGQGVDILWRPLPLNGHIAGAANGAPGVVAWLGDRFAGLPAPENC